MSVWTSFNYFRFKVMKNFLVVYMKINFFIPTRLHVSLSTDPLDLVQILFTNIHNTDQPSHGILFLTIFHQPQLMQWHFQNGEVEVFFKNFRKLYRRSYCVFSIILLPKWPMLIEWYCSCLVLLLWWHHNRRNYLTLLLKIW